MIYKYNMETYLHCGRVAKLSAQIGEIIKLTPEQIQIVKTTALLHDVGKVFIPIEIINQSTKLTPKQWDMVHMHPILGATLYPKSLVIQEGIASHHENYDGTGYPCGLKNNEIPIYGRIIAIADSLDAMTTPRSYRQSISVIDALREIKRCTESKYDPYIVQTIYKYINA